jgi:hypothetical protein
LCTKTIFPFWRPFTVGVNVILNVLFAPGCIVPLVGLTVYRAFDDVTLLITSAAVPVFVTDTLSGFPVAITTIPYARVLRSTENVGTVPVPNAVTVSGDVDPLFVNTINDDCAPAAVGANVMTNFLFAPTAMVPLAGLTVNCALLDLTELMLRLLVPVFVTVTVSDFENPSWTLPIESFFVFTENTPASVLAGEPVLRLSWAKERRGKSEKQIRIPNVGTVFIGAPASRLRNQESGERRLRTASTGVHKG